MQHPGGTTGLPPAVVHVAFSGKRRLFDPDRHQGVDAKAYEEGVVAILTERLKRLRRDLNLTEQRQEICALSSLAIGGDVVFTKACENLGWRQRVFLPQPREDFLAAGQDGCADFPTEEDKAEVRRLLDSERIIEERVTSSSDDRQARFEDVNNEMLRACDVLVCLFTEDEAYDPENDKPKRGGTQAALQLAQRMQKRVLTLTIGFGEGGGGDGDGACGSSAAVLVSDDWVGG
jgi:hypothetical protein